MHLYLLFFSVTEQVHNQKLTTFSFDYLNRIFNETEAEVKRSKYCNNDEEIFFLFFFI